jgi:hypothetical protein
MATLCLPRSAKDAALYTPKTHQLLLDGVEVPAVSSGSHLCAAGEFSCGAAGAARKLSAHLRG